MGTDVPTSPRCHEHKLQAGQCHLHRSFPLSPPSQPSHTHAPPLRCQTCPAKQAHSQQGLVIPPVQSHLAALRTAHPAPPPVAPERFSRHNRLHAIRCAAGQKAICSLQLHSEIRATALALCSALISCHSPRAAIIPSPL